MGLFSERVFDIAAVPSLDLNGETRVDIGFLAGDAHRDAFAALFAKMVGDNPAVGAATLESVLDWRGRPVTLSVDVPAPLRSLDLLGLARELYASGGEKVHLRLAAEHGRMTLGASFDDPEFWIDDRTA